MSAVDACTLASYSGLRARQRLAADTLERKYINVVSGTHDCEEIGRVTLDVTRAGFGPWLQIVPGPFMRATHGEAIRFAHMPVQPGSTTLIMFCTTRSIRHSRLQTRARPIQSSICAAYHPRSGDTTRRGAVQIRWRGRIANGRVRPNRTSTLSLDGRRRFTPPRCRFTIRAQTAS